MALLTTAVVALARYVHGGGLYIAGGALIVSGACLVVLEMLISVTIDAPIRFVWSPYPACGAVSAGVAAYRVGNLPPAAGGAAQAVFRLE